MRHTFASDSGCKKTGTYIVCNGTVASVEVLELLAVKIKQSRFTNVLFYTVVLVHRNELQKQRVSAIIKTSFSQSEALVELIPLDFKS